MGISASDFIRAIADKLEPLFPDVKIYVDKIEQHGQEDFIFVYAISAAQDRDGKNRYKRIYSFDAVYLQDVQDNLALADFAATVLSEFKLLEVSGDWYHITNLETQQVQDTSLQSKKLGGSMHCMFDIVFYTIDIEDVELMDDLTVTTYAK